MAGYDLFLKKENKEVETDKQVWGSGSIHFFVPKRDREDQNFTFEENGRNSE